MRDGLYVNDGAPFVRDDGSWWDTGAEHVPTYNEYIRRTHKLHRVGPAPREAPGGERVVQFPGIDFGSDVAYELAREHLTAADFDGRTGTGEDGAFVKRDIEALLEERG